MTVEGRLDAGNGHAGRLKSNKRGPADLRWPFAVHPHGCGENAWHDSAAIAGITTFSILCRIVWIVTVIADATPVHLLGFQYPVSDRLDCNNLESGVTSPVKMLSVSCVGSSGL